MAFGRRVRRGRRGMFELRLSAGERDVLRALPDRLRSLVQDGDPKADPALARLYPAAYLDDPAAAAEFDGFVHDELTAHRLRAIETMERSIDERWLSHEQLSAWLGAINDLRLVLGVRLAVTEDSEPRDFAGDAETEASYHVYRYLSVLEEEIVDAMAEELERGAAADRAR